MTRIGKFVAVMGVLVCLAGPALRAADESRFFPLSDVRPGLKGVGRTIFEGNKIEEFQVEILGVLKNAIGPKHNTIIARLSGGPLEKTGVIAGMSGSPVYVDGKLLGAVALAFPFSKEPIAGITPIGEMLDVVPASIPASPAKPVAATNFRILRATDSPASDRLIPVETDHPPAWSLGNATGSAGDSLAALRLPLSFGGFSEVAAASALPLFRQLGFEPMQGGALTGSPSNNNAATPVAALEPGAMVSVLLMQGDMNLNVDCTVTYRDADKLYACGHRFLLTGPVDFPFAESHVIVTVPSLASSFKVDAPGPVVGTIHQDRFGAIFGMVGEKARLVPVHIQVDSTLNKKESYDFSMVQESFLSPLLLNLGVVSVLSSSERMVGPSTLELTGKIHLSNGEAVNLEDILAGDFNTATMAGADVAAPLSYVLAADFPDAKVEGIDLNFVSKNEKRLATLDQVWCTKSDVHPGEHIVVTALLRTPSGESVVLKIPVDIPESVTDKTLSLVVGSGANINALQSRLAPQGSMPRDLRQLVRVLNRMRRNNRVYALLMSPQRSFMLQGDEYPSPPPSLVQTLLADPAMSGNVTFSGTSVVGDFQTEPGPYAIQGQKTIFLRVSNAGS